MIFGKYQLLDLLGRGGMAEVYKAKSYGVEGFEKLLVIKRILPNLTDNQKFVEMFINEAKIAVTLNHANIVQVFDLGKVGDSYYIAMEYVHGKDLATIIKTLRKNNGMLPIELAAFIASEVAKGLDYAHRRRDQNLAPLNIIHRDISPHNILISFEGEVRLTDFGIAKAKNTLLEEDRGTIKGKYAYMAPEQAEGKEHDKRVDIFSLGVVLYEMIAGFNPLRGGSSAEILERAQRRDYRPLVEACRRKVPAEMQEIVSRAMDPDPDQRFDGAGDFYETLIAFLYSTRLRAGANSLATFLSLLSDNDNSENSREQEREEPFVAAFNRPSETATFPSIGLDVDDTSDSTSVQVPAQTGDEDYSYLNGTGGGLVAEVRETTVMAMEFIGPSATEGILDKFQSLLLANGGYSAERRNDLLVGIFGLEMADGRDTTDAIDTALKLQRAAMVDDNSFNLRIGFGVVPAKLILLGNGTLREDDAYFEAISKARNMAKQGGGWVLTSKSGRDLAGTSFWFEDIRITFPDGKEHVVSKVVGRRPMADSYGRLFGRRDELRLIGEILALVSRGSGSILEITGEAGTGKTRIMHEVMRRLVSGGHDVGWYATSCAPWRHATPFAAIAALFRSILALDEIEQEEALMDKVERLRELGLIPEEVDAVAAVLGIRTEQNVGPDERGRQLRSAIVRAASRLCADKMTIFFWDDFSYVDKESLEVIRYLGESIRRIPLLLTVAARPGRNTNIGDGPCYYTIHLNPLSERHSKKLALSRMKVRRAPEDLLIEVALKSGGNPLYIEEYIKALRENNIVTIKNGEVTYRSDASLVDFPRTLRGLVADRIKRLPVEQKGMLQRAAVIGQRFSVDLFAHMIGVETGVLRPVLLGLKDMGLLTRISGSEYAFSSELVRDVVYDGIVLSDRREIHASVAQAIEEMFNDRLDEFVERLAVHYREGGERGKAVDYLILAGEKLAADYSHHAALDYYLQALELLQNVSRPDLDRILSIYLPIGRLSLKTSELSLGQKKMRLAEELAEEIGDQRRLVQILRINAELQARADRYLESQQYFQRAIELADSLDDLELRYKVRATAGQVNMWLGDMKKSEPFYREAIELGEKCAEPSFLVQSIAQLAKAQSMSADAESAQKTIERAMPYLSSELDPFAQSEFEQARGQIYYMLRDTEKSLHYQQRSLEVAKEYGLRDLEAKAAHNLGDTYLGLGDFRRAFTYLRMSLDVATEIGHEMLINLNNIFLSFIDALKFGSNDGLMKLEKALALANARNTVWEQVQVHYFLGRIHFERKQFDLAKSHLEQTLRIGRAAENRIYDAQSVDLLAQIAELESEDLSAS